MSLQRIYAIFLRQFFLLRRSPPRLIGIFYWATFELLVWGLITNYLHNIGGENFNFITVLIGTVFLWGFFNRAQQGVTVSFLEDVWSRNLINLFTSPLTVGEYISGLMLVSMVNTMLSFMSMFFIAWLLFSYNIFQFGLMLLPFFFILYVYGWAIGIATTAAVLRFGPAVEVLVWAVSTLILPFSSVFYPISSLPKAIQPISYIIPISYVFEGMRQVVHSGSLNKNLLIFAAVLSVIFLTIAIGIFRRAYRTVLKRGLFTRFMTD